MHDIVKKEGFDFSFDPKACFECGGRCCIGEKGYIWVDKDEIEAISSYLSIDTENFMSDYLKKIKYKYSIKDVLIDGSWECLFFDDKNKECAIYEVRPKQCKSYPFWDHVQNNIEREKQECPGII